MSAILTLPSKGRLKEQAIEIFSNAGMPIELPEDDRSYAGKISGIKGIEVVFMSASEIARELIAGSIHLGVTGEDLVRETVARPDEAVEFITHLGFGGADVIIGVPEAWVDVNTMADLDDVASSFRSHYGRRLRIATKYWQLTQNFFADHGIATYRIVESLGATEGAPAAGQADIIVDITSTGSTLRANQLKILRDGVILKSEANLIASRPALENEAVQELCARVKASL
jgi:ATP phosphoribosyltransferase